MTSATGRPSDRGARDGFTLIELVLVLALLVIAVSIVSPRISGFIRGRAIHSEAHRLYSLLRAGQARAISDGIPAMVWLDAAAGRYGMATETPAGKSDPKELEFIADETLRISVTTGTGTSVTFRDRPAVRWLPDGTADEGSPGRVELRDALGTSLWLVEAADRRGYEIQNATN